MLPLAGRRILITRSRHQASELAGRLEVLGATTILIPTIEIAPPLTYAPLDEAIAHLDQFDWLVFTSANAVEAFRQRAANQSSHAMAHIQTAAIGPATARAASAIGLNVALIPPKAVAESLATALLSKITPRSRILLVRAAIARDHLPEALIAAGAEVTIRDAYRTCLPKTSLFAIEHIFGDPTQFPDAVTFASSSTVTHLMTLLEAARRTLPLSIVRVSIGPITTQTLCDHGFPPHLQAPDASIASLAGCLAEYLVNHR